ncbi:hypothetical protein TRAPUB_12683 [Trametes pubescens]|uniref:Uncharacterized protein n=1 Tax=Trametes pubescens TaxID=154538 RepID=A0A1M2VT89_TRAPU|nr:hypothetical protein TRAPUB_12683 [Trametes pubescens]
MRILLTFLMDPDARPTPKDMKLWVDVIRFVKRGARGGALSFFTYMELSACPSAKFSGGVELMLESLEVAFEKTLWIQGSAIIPRGPQLSMPAH